MKDSSMIPSKRHIGTGSPEPYDRHNEGDQSHSRESSSPLSDVGKKRDLTKILRQQLEQPGLPKSGVTAEGLKSPASSEPVETSLEEQIDRGIAKFDENRRSFEKYKSECEQAFKNAESVKKDVLNANIPQEEKREIADTFRELQNRLKENKKKFEEIESGFEEVKSKFDKIKLSNPDAIKARFSVVTTDRQPESRSMSPASREFAEDAWKKMQAHIKWLHEKNIKEQEENFKKNIKEQKEKLKKEIKDLPTYRKGSTGIFEGEMYWAPDSAASNAKRAKELLETIEGVLDSSRQLLKASEESLKDDYVNFFTPRAKL